MQQCNLKVLFLLSRAMILLIDRKMNDVLAIFHQASIVIEGSIQNLHLKEYLKVFYLVLQVNFIIDSKNNYHYYSQFLSYNLP